MELSYFTSSLTVWTHGRLHVVLLSSLVPLIVNICLFKEMVDNTIYFVSRT